MIKLSDRSLRRLLEEVTGPYKEKRERSLAKLQSLEQNQLWEKLNNFLSINDVDLVCRTFEAMMHLDSKRGHPILISQISKNDSTVRWQICNLLTHYGNSESLETLSYVLRNDPEPDVRIYAAIALGSIGSKRSIPDLEWTIENDEGKDSEGRPVRESAQRALLQINTI